MEFGCREVLDLSVFDEKGNFIVKLNTLQNSPIFYDDVTENYYIGITDVLFNLELQKFLNPEKEISDFEIAAKGYISTIGIKKPSTRKCKLIGKTIMRKRENGIDETAIFECHNAEINSKFKIDLNIYKASTFDYVFKLNVDKDGDYFKFTIKA